MNCGIVFAVFGVILQTIVKNEKGEEKEKEKKKEKEESEGLYRGSEMEKRKEDDTERTQQEGS